MQPLSDFFHSNTYIKLVGCYPDLLFEDSIKMVFADMHSFRKRVNAKFRCAGFDVSFRLRNDIVKPFSASGIFVTNNMVLELLKRDRRQSMGRIRGNDIIISDRQKRILMTVHR